MIPLTGMPSTEENTPVHIPFNNHAQCVGGSLCSAHSLPAHRFATTVRLERTAAVAPMHNTSPDWWDRMWAALTCGGGIQTYCCGQPGAAHKAVPIVSKARSRALMVDVVSRVLFPVMFIIFNLIYWPAYLM